MDSMDSFHNNPISTDELHKWNLNKTKNPRTNKKISDKGEIYKYLQSEYIKMKKLPILKLEDSIDDKDPISLAVFWIEKDNKKVIIYTDIKNLILYKDIRGLVRCFEKESLEYIKAHNITKHPITLEDIPNEVLDKITAKNLEKKTVSDIAFNIFQKFANMSIFIDADWFLSLPKDKLIKFNYEISDMYNQNFTPEQKNEISKIKLFTLDEHSLNNKNLEEIQEYLLEQMNYILDVHKEDLKYMCNYLLLGSLSLIIPKIRELYPDFCFTFNL